MDRASADTFISYGDNNQTNSEAETIQVNNNNSHEIPTATTDNQHIIEENSQTSSETPTVISDNHQIISASNQKGSDNFLVSNENHLNNPPTNDLSGIPSPGDNIPTNRDSRKNLVGQIDGKENGITLTVASSNLAPSLEDKVEVILVGSEKSNTTSRGKEDTGKRGWCCFLFVNLLPVYGFIGFN